MIFVNGQEEKIPADLFVSAYLKEKQYRTDRIAVELNGSILPKTAYESTLLQEGDHLEIVSFVGGG